MGLTASVFQPCAHHDFVGAVMGAGGGLPRGNLILKVEVTPSSLHSHASDILRK